MKPRESALTHEMLTEALDYDPETGVFTWKKITSNRVKVGQVAAARKTISNGRKTYQDQCRVYINLNGFRYMAHRLAWFYVHKVWPAHEIDHINRNPEDNRIVNLREATRAENNRNAKKKNRTGFRGVSLHESGKYMSKIRNGEKSIYLGVFNTAEEAHAAYAEASKLYHGEYGRLD